MDKRIMKGKSAEERQSFVESATHNQFVLDAVLETFELILVDKQKALSKDDYDVSNWSHLAADRNGEIRAYRDVCSMIRSIKTK